MFMWSYIISDNGEMFIWMLHETKWNDNMEMFMWVLHNKMLIRKCLCECYIIRRLYGNVYLNVT
jgi:hypothetical protein